MSLRGLFADLLLGSCYVRTGSGSPEGSVIAPVGSVYLRTGGGAGTTFFVKESGSGNTGWVAMASASSLTSGLVKQATVTLTDAQIKALPTTPITLVTAPGSGFRVKVLSYTLRADTSAGAYTNIDATYADVHLVTDTYYAGYGPVRDATVSPALTTLADMFGSAAQTVFDGFANNVAAYDANVAATPFLDYVQPPSLFGVSTVDNKALQIGMDNNGSGALTGGNVANTLKVTVYYAVEAI